MGRVVGIDLGTTYCVVAAVGPGGPRVLGTREGLPQMPSVVSLLAGGRGGRGEAAVGAAALANAPRAPRDTITSIRRLVGRAFDHPEVKRVADSVQYEIVPSDDGPQAGACVVMGGVRYSAVEISAMILMQLKDNAEHQLREKVTHAVIAVPASFSLPQREATREAASGAGLGVIQMLDEPTAAAIAFGVEDMDGDQAQARTVLVFDLGGGTFDVSVLATGGNSFVPLAVEGDSWLGGDDFDQVLVDLAIRHCEEEYGIGPTEFSERFMAAAKRAAQETKERLTGSRSADLLIPGCLTDKDGNVIDIAQQVTREEFEAMIQPLVDRTVALVERALENAKLSKDDIDCVLMAGGSAAVPLVQKSMESFFGAHKLVRNVHAKYCVALGAAIVAARVGARLICQAPSAVDPTTECGCTNETDATECRDCGAPLQPLPVAASAPRVITRVATPHPDEAPFHKKTFWGSRGLPAPEVSDAPADGQRSSRTGSDQPPYLDENVQFTVCRPRAVKPEEWYPLLAFAHLSERRPDAPPSEPHPVEEVQKQAAKILGERLEDYREVTQDSPQAVPREGEITFVPEIPGVEFNPSRRSFLWLESVHREEFRLRASRNLEGQTARGRLSVFLGSIVLAEVNLSIRVDSRATPESAAVDAARESARRYRKVFASYSHRDTNVVEEFERYALALGDEYLRDVSRLRSGQMWGPQLMEMIDEADLFQLFWSWNSIDSEFVQEEWRYALSLGRPLFVRPVYWEEPLPERPARRLPPDDLRRLHFQRIGVPAAVVSGTRDPGVGEETACDGGLPARSAPIAASPQPLRRSAATVAWTPAEAGQERRRPCDGTHHRLVERMAQEQPHETPIEPSCGEAGRMEHARRSWSTPKRWALIALIALALVAWFAIVLLAAWQLGT